MICEELITCFDIFFSEANDDSPSDFALWLTYWFDETPNLTVLATGRAWSMLNGTPILAVSSPLCLWTLHNIAAVYLTRSKILINTANSFSIPV